MCEYSSCGSKTAYFMRYCLFHHVMGFTIMNSCCIKNCTHTRYSDENCEKFKQAGSVCCETHVYLMSLHIHYKYQQMFKYHTVILTMTNNIRSYHEMQ